MRHASTARNALVSLLAAVCCATGLATPAATDPNPAASQPDGNTRPDHGPDHFDLQAHRGRCQQVWPGQRGV
ncbi:MAG: hypothetical protein M3308_02395 [Actinomycetota bacterium]|nr:hypothetical protein [Actinomycetota bacterium]